MGWCDILLSPTMKWTRPHDNFCSPSPTLLTPSLSEILSNWTKSNNQSIIQSINQTIDKSINHQSLDFGASVLWLLWGKTIHVIVLKRWNNKIRDVQWLIAQRLRKEGNLDYAWTYLSTCMCIWGILTLWWISCFGLLKKKLFRNCEMIS